jgi:hypothetical protein
MSGHEKVPMLNYAGRPSASLLSTPFLRVADGHQRQSRILDKKLTVTSIQPPYDLSACRKPGYRQLFPHTSTRNTRRQQPFLSSQTFQRSNPQRTNPTQPSNSTQPFMHNNRRAIRLPPLQPLHHPPHDTPSVTLYILRPLHKRPPVLPAIRIRRTLRHYIPPLRIRMIIVRVFRPRDVDFRVIEVFEPVRAAVREVSGGGGEGGPDGGPGNVCVAGVLGED